MDRRSGSSKMPQGQTGCGPGQTTSVNPKNNSSRRADVIGQADGQGGAANQGSGYDQHANGYKPVGGPNRFDKSGSEPDPSIMNRGYTPNTGGVPSTTVISADRVSGDIDPGDVTLTPKGDSSPGPMRPRYGVGGSGD